MILIRGLIWVNFYKTFLKQAPCIDQVRQEQEPCGRLVLRLLLGVHELPQQGRRLELRLQLPLLHHGLPDGPHHHRAGQPQVPASLKHNWPATNDRFHQTLS